MSHWVALVLCLAGFAALALATDRQQHEILGRALERRATLGLRTAGWVALALGLAVLVARSGWALGLVVFSGMTSLAAGVVYGVLIARARLVPSRARN